MLGKLSPLWHTVRCLRYKVWNRLPPMIRPVFILSTHPNSAVEFHDDLAEKWELKYERPAFSKRVRAFFQLLDAYDLSNKRWLDAGCGSGFLTCRLAERACAVTAVDASPKMIRVAHELTEHKCSAYEHKPIFKLIKTVEKLDFQDSSFDGIVCSSVIEYVDHPMDTIKEFARILRAPGLLIISIPNRHSLLRIIEKACYWASTHFFGIPWPAYLQVSRHEYTREDFYAALGRYDFTVVSSTHYGPGLPDCISRTRFGGSLIIVLASKVVAGDALIRGHGKVSN